MVNNPDNTMPNNSLSRKSPKSDQLVQGMLEEDKKFRQEQRERVVLAKQNTPDKQPFNMETFGSLYNLRDNDGELRITPELVEDYEVEYYLKNPSIKSIEEFAERRKKLDAESAQ